MTTLGIFGGTFDPIHLGHLLAAETARDALGLDRVIFVPAGAPWHRQSAPNASVADRLAMARLAVSSNPVFAVSSVDADRAGPTYTVDTLRLLQQEYPAARLMFLMGDDALAQVPRWRTPAAMVALADLAVLSRPDSPPFDLLPLRALVPDIDQHVRRVAMPLIGISATAIRQRVAEGRSIRYWTPDSVAAYIAEHALYRR